MRLLLVLAGVLAILAGTGTPSSTLPLLALVAGAGIGVAGVAACHVGWRRPVSDAMAWVGTATVLVALGSPPASLPHVLAVAAGVVCLAVGLHVPAAGAPHVRVRAGLATWSTVAGLAVAVAWAPLLLARGDVVVLDPLTSTGMALRLAVTAVLLALAAALLALWRGRRGLPA